MTHQEKPFIYLKGASGIKISPRNASGWKSFALWLSAQLPLMGLYLLVIVTTHRPAILIAATLIYLAALGLLIGAMIRWMLARSEIVDFAD